MPNPFLEILKTQGLDEMIRALEAEPIMTPALKAAIYGLKTYASMPF